MWITYLLSAKEDGYEDMEFSRTITIYPDEQYVYDGVLIYEQTGDMEVSLAEDSEDGIDTYVAKTITVHGTGIYMNYLGVGGAYWSTGTEVMYASVNGYNRLVYCLCSRKRTPNGTNNYTGRFSGALQKKMNYVLYHGARYYGNTCYTSKYSTGNASGDYYVTCMAVHMLNAAAKNEPGYNLWDFKFSGSAKTYYNLSKKLYDDANKNYNDYSADDMWKKDAVSISPAPQQSWKWDNKNNYYRVTGDFTPSFGDTQTYTKRSGASSVNVDTGKSMGTIHFFE